MRPLPLIPPELHRSLRTIESAQGPKVVLEGREVLLLCSNDYLGLAGDPRVREAAAEFASRWGAGAGASPLVSGNMAPHRELCARLAELKGTEACVLFGSGFLANTGVIAALCTDGIVASDALNHASIVDGCRLARAQTRVYAHGTIPVGADTIVTDAVFSMDGDVADLVGAGRDGRAGDRRRGARDGRDRRYRVEDWCTSWVCVLGVITVGTLGKALGSYGAFVCCDARTADVLVNRARTMIYSTALPPPSVGAALRALELMPSLVPRLHSNARVLRAALGVEVSDMPIVPLVVGSPEAALARSAAAFADGVFAQAIRPPTVPDGTSRLRLVATAAHSPEDLRRAALSVRGDGQVEQDVLVRAGLPGGDVEAQLGQVHHD